MQSKFQIGDLVRTPDGLKCLVLPFHLQANAHGPFDIRKIEMALVIGFFTSSDGWEKGKDAVLLIKDVKYIARIDALELVDA